MFAVAVAFSTSAFAQDVYKQVSKMKDYNEAYNLVKNNLGTLSAEQKAKCYNALVDLAYGKVMKEQGTITENQMAEQMKTETKPYDTVGLYDAVINALQNGLACDEFDMQPNEKGKVKPKFHKANADRLYPIRFHLINGGMYYQNIDRSKASKFLGAYVDSSEYPLFNEQDKSGDASLTQIAYYAAYYAYMDKDYAKTEKYADIAMNDPEMGKDALQLKLASMQSQLKSREDTINYVAKLKELYTKDESNDMIFSTVCSMLMSLNQKAEVTEFVNAKLAKDQNNVAALTMRGEFNMNEHKWDEAIADLTKVASTQPDNIAVLASIGNSYMYKAQEAAERASANGKRIAPAAEEMIVGVYKQAMDYLEKAKTLDKNMEFKKFWAYSLYRCSYAVNGPDHEDTKAAEALIK